MYNTHLNQKAYFRTRNKKWTKEDDDKLRIFVRHFPGDWRQISQLFGEEKNPKNCQQRWVNQLDPSIDHGPFSHEEEWTLFLGVSLYGKRWCEISTMFINRPNKKLKNYWNTERMKYKRALFTQIVKQIFLMRCLEQIRRGKETKE